MFQLNRLKKERQDGGGDSETRKSGSEKKASPQKKLNAAALRVQKDLSEITMPDTCKLFFPNYDDYLKFYLAVMPDEGFYKGGRIIFSFTIPSDYPIAPPKIKCVTIPYHPNIDLEGNVCLNILREDWKPVLSISSVMYGLQFLLLEPNPDDPLNEDAAECLKTNRKLFQDYVTRSMHGGTVDSVKFNPYYNFPFDQNRLWG